VFPHDVHPGDRHTDAEGREWEVLDHPAVFRQGKMVQVRLGLPGDPSALWEPSWPAHQRITIRRPGA
jgi:hypothetical protein